jgi:PAS domain S-box-containing protein
VHRLLKRQIKRAWIYSNRDFDSLPKDLYDGLTRFFSFVEESYNGFDIEKTLLENTVKVNSEELTELNRKIRIENELRLKGLMEQAPYGFIIIDFNGKIVEVNQFASKLLRYERDSLLGLNIEVLFQPLEKSSFEEIRKSVVNNIKFNIDDKLAIKNGKSIPVEITAGKFVIKGVTHILIMFQDIIKRVQAQQIASIRQKEIERLNKTLEERVREEVSKNIEKDQLLIQQSKMAAMGDMLGNIAHQWRQPLNALAITVQDVEEAFLFDEVDNQYIKNFVDSAMKHISFMSKTIDDFRNFFKPSKSKVKFSIKSAIEDILFIVSAQLKNKNIEISLIGEDFEVNGYLNEFKQVILNLTNNAKDAILIKKKKEPDFNGNIEIAMAPFSERYKKVTIKDNGGGVPDKIIDRIFEPYFTTKEGNQGTGIGLYMSKTIIEENMRGFLTVENCENGAIFKIMLPCTCSISE